MIKISLTAGFGETPEASSPRLGPGTGASAALIPAPKLGAELGFNHCP